MRKTFLFLIYLFWSIGLIGQCDKIFNQIIEVTKNENAENENLLSNEKRNLYLTVYNNNNVYERKIDSRINVLISKDDCEGIKDFTRISNIAEEFSCLLPKNLKDFSYGNARAILTSSVNKEEIVVFLELVQGKVQGYLHKLNLNQNKNEKWIDLIFKGCKESGVNNMYWYGDNLKQENLYDYADRYSINIYRRNFKEGRNNLPSIDIERNFLESKTFTPSNSIIVNAIPSTKKELDLTGNSRTGFDGWKKYKKEVDALTKTAFEKIKPTAENLKKELIEGEKDVVFIVAHSDKLFLFIGKDKISINNIKEWPSRDIETSGQRIAVLLSCKTGEIDKVENYVLFRKKIESLSDVILQKGYFDLVIAPNYDIKENDVKSFIQGILQKKTVFELRNMLNAGWYEFVMLERKPKEFYLNYL